jgi:DNA-binding transcriptional ArsR family regulator
VAELAAQLPVSRPAVSQHLKVLKDAGLVRAEARGTRRVYSLDPEGAAELRRYVTSLWDAALSGLERTAPSRTGASS